MKGIAKIIVYIMSDLPMTWDHPFYPIRTTKVAILLVKTPQINIVLVHLWYSPVNTSDCCIIIGNFMVFTSEYQ